MTNFNKFLSYISFLFLCFFLFNIDVNAKLYNSGDCIYNFNKVNASVRINQDVSGNVKYYFSYEKLTSSDAQGWGEVGDIIHIDVDSNNSIYDKCPKYAHYKQDKVTGFINFYFSDNKKENESYQEDVAVNSSPKLNAPPTSENGEGATCAQTKKPDWLNSVSDSSELVQDEAHCLYQGENEHGCYLLQIDYVPSVGYVTATSNFATSWSYYKDKSRGSFGTGTGEGFALLPWDYDLAKGSKGYAAQSLKIGCPSVVGIKCGGESITSMVISYPEWLPEVLRPLFGASAAQLPICRFSFNERDKDVALHRIKEASIKRSATVPKWKKITSCDELLNDDLSKLLKSIVGWIRILVPIMLICLGVADFGMAIFASDEEKMKKAQSKFIRRLIIGVVIFLIPSFLKLFLSFAHEVWPFVDATLCGIL